MNKGIPIAAAVAVATAFGSYVVWADQRYAEKTDVEQAVAQSTLTTLQLRAKELEDKLDELYWKREQGSITGFEKTRIEKWAAQLEDIRAQIRDLKNQ